MQELDKILEEIEKLKKMYKESSLSLIDKGNLPCEYDKSDIESAKMQAISEAITIIRKHMNDGWIPTKERMPTKEECERDNIRFLISVGVDCWYSTEIAKCSWVEADNADGTDGSYSEFWIDQFPHIYRPSHRLIAAWKILELPEPYIPRKER